MKTRCEASEFHWTVIGACIFFLITGTHACTSVLRFFFTAVPRCYRGDYPDNRYPDNPQCISRNSSRNGSRKVCNNNDCMSVKHSGKNDFIEVYKNQTRFRKFSLENNYRLFVTIGKNSFASI